MALDRNLLQSINVTAFFFRTYLLSNFSQTHFVERVMSFVLGNTSTSFPPCLVLCKLGFRYLFGSSFICFFFILIIQCSVLHLLWFRPMNLLFYFQVGPPATTVVEQHASENVGDVQVQQAHLT